MSTACLCCYPLSLLSIKLPLLSQFFCRISFYPDYFFFRHVQVNNDQAINFYKRFNFEIKETKEHYYKRIEPADAYVLEKTLTTVSADKENDSTVANDTGIANQNDTEKQKPVKDKH